MVKLKYLVIFLSFIAACIVAFFFIFENQEAKIKKQFKFIAEKIEKSQEESPLISAAKAKSLTKVIANPCLINISAYSYSKETSSESLTRYILTMRSQYSGIVMSFYDFVFDHMDETTAQVTVTSGMRGTLKTGEVFEDIHEVTCKLKKIDDIWKFFEIEVIEVLKK